MRIGDAYLTIDLGGQDEPLDGYLPTIWVVGVITQIGSEQVGFDTYLGGPSIPWRYGGENSLDRALFLGETPMTDHEKESYHFAELSQEERAALSENLLNLHDQPTDESDDTLNSLLAGLSPAERALFDDLSQEEQHVIIETLKNAHDQRTGKKADTSNSPETGVILGVGGIVVAFMMMR